MTKKKRSRYTNQSRQQSRTTQPKQPAVVPLEPDILQQVEEVAIAARAKATEADMEHVGIIDIPSNLPPDAIKNLYSQMEEARRLLTAQYERLKLEEKKLVDQQKSYDEKHSKFDEDKDAFLEEKAELKEK